MTKKTRLKLRDFARRHALTDVQAARLGASLEKASAAQAECLLRQAGRLLLTTRLKVEVPQPSLIERPASGLVDPSGRPA